MNIPIGEKAAILAQALPWIRRHAGRTVVVKYGGAAMVNENVREAVAQDLVLMSSVGIRTVLVHGGGPEIDALLGRLGKEPRFIEGLRYTDEETMEAVQMVLAGKVNKELAALIQRQGGRAIGLSGLDGGLLAARRLAKNGVDLGLVGQIVAVNPAPLAALLQAGYLPVVATVAAGLADEEERVFNVNADSAAAEIAAALGAEKLVLLTDVPGILRDLADGDTLISRIERAELGALIKEGLVSRGMIPKVECCARALEKGVETTHIIDGRVPHALLLEVFSDEGVGTMIC